MSTDTATASTNGHADLGARIRERRRALGRSQMWLAQRIGVHTSNICHIEKGRHNPRPSTARAIDRVLSLDHATKGHAAATVSIPSSLDEYATAVDLPYREVRRLLRAWRAANPASAADFGDPEACDWAGLHAVVRGDG